jgi:hypothetical protein
MAASSKLPTAPPAQSQTLKVIYVMGAGRSGSTILGVTLGNCAGFFYAGELDKWLPYGGVPRLDGAARARLWDQVRRDMGDPAGLFGHRARCLERSSSLFRVRRWRARRTLRGAYVQVAGDLYRAVARAAGASQLIDTSHYPLRARELQRMRGVDVYLLFLVRDPHSVVRSFAAPDVREPMFGALKTNAYLWLTHLVSVFVFLRQPRERRVFLRYEDFLANPEGILRNLLDRLGSAAEIPDLRILKTGVPLEGNRLLGADTVSLDQQVNRSPRSTLTTLAQLPWALVFSRLRPTAAAAPARASARLDAS